MEVHHHPHVAHKSFKEYLLEGLMIFFAVSLGFFAEKVREKIYSSEREKEYVSSLINNLEEDETLLHQTIDNNQKKIKGLDSLLALDFTSLSREKKERLYTYCQKYVSYYSGFASNDATMMQLKNAGGFEYIKSHKIADSIAMYDLEIRDIYAAEQTYGKAISNAIDAMSEVLVLRVHGDTSYFKNGFYTGKELPMLGSDKNKMDVFFNKIFIERAWTENYVRNLRETLLSTTRLIKLLHGEYGDE